MAGRRTCSKVPAYAALLLALSLALPASLLAARFGGNRWNHGARDYDNIIEEATEKDRPFILYIHVDWCGWCRKLNSDYLEDRDIDGFLDDVIKVEVNPEDGRAEKAVAEKYGVKSYPSFMIIHPGTGRSNLLTPFRSTGALTPEAFLLEIRRALAGLTVQRGQSFWPDNEQAKSVRYFEEALRYDPQNAVAHYALGVCAEKAAELEKDPEALKEAATQYRKAFELDSKLERAKTALERVLLAIKKSHPSEEE